MLSLNMHRPEVMTTMRVAVKSRYAMQRNKPTLSPHVDHQRLFMTRVRGFRCWTTLECQKRSDAPRQRRKGELCSFIMFFLNFGFLVGFLHLFVCLFVFALLC